MARTLSPGDVAELQRAGQLVFVLDGGVHVVDRSFEAAHPGGAKARGRAPLAAPQGSWGRQHLYRNAAGGAATRLDRGSVTGALPRLRGDPAPAVQPTLPPPHPCGATCRCCWLTPAATSASCLLARGLGRRSISSSRAAARRGDNEAGAAASQRTSTAPPLATCCAAFTLGGWRAPRGVAGARRSSAARAAPTLPTPLPSPPPDPC